jgi:hypothetical protein
MVPVVLIDTGCPKYVVGGLVFDIIPGQIDLGRRDSDGKETSRCERSSCNLVERGDRMVDPNARNGDPIALINVASPVVFNTLTTWPIPMPGLFSRARAKNPATWGAAIELLPTRAVGASTRARPTNTDSGIASPWSEKLQIG